jgi:hypothetical protein
MLAQSLLDLLDLPPDHASMLSQGLANIRQRLSINKHIHD